jgi:plastocyanin
MMPSSRWSLPSIVLAALVAGCGDGPSGTGDNPPSSASVDVGNNFFRSGRNGSLDPAVDTVAVGGTVTWTWVEAGSHGVRFDDPALSDGAELSASGSVSSTMFPTAGTFTYDCIIHGEMMAGTIVVK